MHPKRLESRIQKAMTRANRDFRMIGDGDRILVALSGGKDSWGLLWGLQRMRAAAPFNFDLFGFHLDQGQPGHDTGPIRAYLEQTGLPFEIEFQDTYTRVVELTKPGKVYCSLCSRFRRAILYKAADRHGCNKVAVGHHSDDLIETLLLSIFFSGQIKSMPPKLVSATGTQELIRPLVYAPESELAELAELHEFPITPCSLCGSQEKERVFIKKLLADLSEHSRHLKGSILHALSNVQPTHLMDKALNPYLDGGPAIDVDDDDGDEAGDEQGRDPIDPCASLGGRLVSPGPIDTRP